MRVIIILLSLLSSVAVYAQDGYTLYLEFRANDASHHWQELPSEEGEPKNYCISYDLQPIYNSYKDTITMASWSFSFILDDSSKTEYANTDWVENHRVRDINWLRFMWNETNDVGFFALMKSYKNIIIFKKEAGRLKLYHCTFLCRPSSFGDKDTIWNKGGWPEKH